MIPLDAVAVIVSGGKSSRMKQDKSLLPFGHYDSLAQYQVERLRGLFSKVYLSAKSNKFDFKVQIIQDNYEDSSPLVALISIFENLEVEEVFILSVDAPFVANWVIETLYKHTEPTVDIVMAESNNGLEPLCAIYKRSFLKEAYIALQENNHRLQSLMSNLTVKAIKIEDEDVFMNLNYPREYEEAKSRLL